MEKFPGVQADFEPRPGQLADFEGTVVDTGDQRNHAAPQVRAFTVQVPLEEDLPVLTAVEDYGGGDRDTFVETNVVLGFFNFFWTRVYPVSHGSVPFVHA